LGDVVLNASPDKNSYKIVISAHYSIDVDLLRSEKKIFLQFLEESKSVTTEGDFKKVESAADLVRTMKSFDLDSVLPVFFRR